MVNVKDVAANTASVNITGAVAANTAASSGAVAASGASGNPQHGASPIIIIIVVILIIGIIISLVLRFNYNTKKKFRNFLDQEKEANSGSPYCQGIQYCKVK